MCHDMMRDNTYMSQVEVDILLHSVMVVDSYGIPSVLCFFQRILYLILHLCSQLDLLAVCCTEALDYTARGYTVAVRYCTMVAQYCTVVVHCYMGLVLG
jgi:hypothetical protein